jgi:hypothetical protein
LCFARFSSSGCNRASGTMGTDRLIVIRLDTSEWQVQRQTLAGYQTIVKQPGLESLRLYLQENAPRDIRLPKRDLRRQQPRTFHSTGLRPHAQSRPNWAAASDRTFCDNAPGSKRLSLFDDGAISNAALAPPYRPLAVARAD